MRAIAFAVLLLLGSLATGDAQFNGCAAGFCGTYPGTPPPCTPGVTYLAALSGLSGTERSAYITAICALNTNGYLARMDGFYIHANASAANARVNAVNPSALAITTHGSCTFTADRGFTGDGSSCYQDAGFNPSTFGGQYALNSASAGVCILNNRTSPSASSVAFGGADATPHYMYFEPLLTGGDVASGLNDASGGALLSSSSSQGDWAMARSLSTGFVIYLGGTSYGSVTSTSTALPNASIFEMAFNNNGSTIDFTTDQQAVWWFGGAFNGTEIAAIHTIIHNLTAALGATGC